jgi:hypothetical protein
MPVERRPRLGHLVDHQGSRRLGRCKGEGSRGPDGRVAQAAVGYHVFNRLVRVILGNRTVIVMMMRLPLPVQQGVSNLFHLCEGSGLARNGESLPNRREQEKDEGKPAAHPASLAEAALRTLAKSRRERGGADRAANPPGEDARESAIGPHAAIPRHPQCSLDP